MKVHCPECGNEIREGKSFCSSCGALLDIPPEQAPAQPPQPASPQVLSVQSVPPPPAAQPPGPPVPPPAVPAYPPVPAPGAKKSNKWVLAVVIPLAVLVVLGVALGLVFGLSSSYPVTAKISSVDLNKKGGGSVDTDKVPLQTNVVVTVKYKADFPANGEGTLVVTVVGEDGEDMVKKEVSCEPGKETQTYEVGFSIDKSEGKPMDAKASLEVVNGNQKLNDKGSLEFTAQKGDPEEEERQRKAREEEERKRAEAEKAQWDATWNQVYAQIQNAINNVNDLSNNGIDTSGLPELLTTATNLLDSATNLEQLIGQTNSAMFYANYVINECNARRTAVAAARAEEERRRREQPAPSPEPSDIWVTCPTCGGAGGWWMTDEMGWTGWVTCQDCGGTGSILVPND